MTWVLVTWAECPPQRPPVLGVAGGRRADLTVATRGTVEPRPYASGFGAVGNLRRANPWPIHAVRRVLCFVNLMGDAGAEELSADQLLERGLALYFAEILDDPFLAVRLATHLSAEGKPHEQ